MGSFSIDIGTDRGARDVFAVLADVAAMPRWYEPVKEVLVLRPDVTGLGARYNIGRTLPGGPVLNEVAVTEYVTDQLFTVESDTGPTPFGCSGAALARISERADNSSQCRDAHRRRLFTADSGNSGTLPSGSGSRQPRIAPEARTRAYQSHGPNASPADRGCNGSESTSI